MGGGFDLCFGDPLDRVMWGESLMAKKRSQVSRKIAKITREEKKKPKGDRLDRKQIAGKAFGMTRRSKRGR